MYYFKKIFSATYYLFSEILDIYAPFTQGGRSYAGPQGPCDRGPPPKSLDSDENFKPEHTLFCGELRFVAIYSLFGDNGQKNAFVGQKQFFLGKKCAVTW